MSEAAIHTAMDAARIFLSDTAERRRYLNREMARMDYDSGLLHAERKGEQIGEDKMGRLMQILFQEKDFANAQAASTDKALRESLYRKYHIV